ncbi:hypothetical protein C5167_025858 [Papaver somniferum]|uniref:Uncharacterized protein n=1 Tax=Papaver somniferum TaxID=3469 RepID=A0A4Y7JTS2_PAPSO|nr:hypothetical protein C5167_025858 [Papaver somniferum]
MKKNKEQVNGENVKGDPAMDENKVSNTVSQCNILQISNDKRTVNVEAMEMVTTNPSKWYTRKSKISGKKSNQNEPIPICDMNPFCVLESENENENTSKPVEGETTDVISSEEKEESSVVSEYETDVEQMEVDKVKTLAVKGNKKTNL